MTATHLSAADVARFLQDNPDFFTEHADIFADLRVPHPHQASAISLGQRQILTLRSRTRELERQLSGLVHNASGNERISTLLIDWCASLLSEDDPHRLPDLIVKGLAERFELPDIALRLWELPRLADDNPFVLPVSTALQTAMHERDQPWCGVPTDHEAASWLSQAPASLALLPLKTGTPSQTLGVLVLASSDATRFTSDMGTDFLKTIATLAAAALSRLAGPGHPQSA